MGRRCLFPWCKSSRVLHGFPRDAARAEVWLRAVGWPSSTDTTKLFVCSKHFSRESYENWRKVDFGLAPEGTLRLGKDAVPSPEDFSIPPKAFLCYPDPGSDITQELSYLSQAFCELFRRKQCSSVKSVHVFGKIQPKTCREMGCQTEEPSTKDGQCQTIHDLKQRNWKLELKSERVFYCFLHLFFNGL